jgi:mannose-6-phosphate isomerase-like protein (cupin superfamily)
MGETLKLTPSESVTIREDTPAALEVEGRWGPGGSPPPKHYHPSQDERFEVLQGGLHARVDGAERVLGAGEVLEIPRGSVHQMWNPGKVEARATWRTTPAMRTASWFRAIDALHRSGRVGSNGMPGPLAFGVLLNEYREVFRLAGPDLVLRPALAALGAIGRARGYRATA